MRVDLYTKVVLTVIAACLVAITYRAVDFVAPARADIPQKIEVSFERIPMLDLNLVNFAPNTDKNPIYVTVK